MSPSKGKKKKRIRKGGVEAIDIIRMTRDDHGRKVKCFEQLGGERLNVSTSAKKSRGVRDKVE